MNESGSDLQKHAMDTWQVIRNRLGLITLSFLLVFAAAAVLTYIMPRKYRGRVEMTIERQPNAVAVFAKDFDNRQGFTPEYIKTQTETISKPATLYPVMEKLELTKRWEMPSTQAALARMRGNLDVQSSLRSDFVSIEFYDQDAQLAADIANNVAESYMSQHIKIETEQKQKSLDIISQQIAQEEAKRRNAQDREMEARKKAGIVGDWIVGGGSTLQAGAEIKGSEQATLMSREQRLLMSKSELRTLESEIQQVEKLTPDEIIAQASGLRLENPALANNVTKYQELVVQRDGLISSGLGKRHPTVSGLNNQIETLHGFIAQAAQDHVRGLQGRLAAKKSEIAALEGDSDVAKGEAMDMQQLYNDYKRAKDEVAHLEQTLIQMKNKFFEEQAAIKLVQFPATIYAKAEPESRPAKPNIPLNLALGGILGLMFGVGLAFFLEYLDTSVKSLDDVEKFLGVPVLAVVPKGVGVLHRSSGFNPDSEAYRILRTNIEFNRKSPDLNCLTVVSGGAGEGKSTTMVNLAYICAQGGYNVLLIDADLRRPSMHRHFDVSHTVGLTNYLTQNIQLEDVVMRTPVENLFFLPSGLLPADSAGILNSQRMVDLIADVKSRFDLVLIDSPPILGVSDASVLANEADMTMIVVQHRKLPRNMLLRVKQTVENVGGKVIGVVLNNVDLTSDTQYSYYTSYYTYYSPNNPVSGDAKPSRRKKRKQATVADIGPPMQPGQSAGGDVF
ncbi:MAG: polysaccharide biosynthesis tyrosine autokinase [Verrucomicrobiaceae bacterium]|nr:polysaccharide biosynthesis tyrosine autokinase [Verrucomicrobiaceae bacterium]